MNQPRAMITFSLGYKRLAPFLGLKQTQSSSKGVLSATSQEKQKPRKKKHCSSCTKNDFQSENISFLEFAQDRLGHEPTAGKKSIRGLR
jgi:hypothetical protein